MAHIGVAPHVVEAALNHISGAKAGVAGTYNREHYIKERAAALAAVGRPRREGRRRHGRRRRVSDG